MPRKLFFIFLFPILFLTVYAFGGDSVSEFDDFQKSKQVYFQDDYSEFLVETNAKTVTGFIREQNINVEEFDEVFPTKNVKIYSGSKIIIKRAKKIHISVDGKDVEKYTFESNVGAALEGIGMELKKEDIVEPNRNSFVYNGAHIKITRVKIKKIKEIQKIEYDTKIEKDDDMGWREEKIVRDGENGQKEIIYKVVYHDNKEIFRDEAGSEVIKKPVDKIIKQGTYVKYGKTHTGLGTWYGQPDHLKAAYPSITGYYAANPWLPKGSYVKVTNKANGKSVIVRINDRGPFGENRIIDLNKRAFAAIASLGAGVLDVKVEEILN